MPRSFSKLALVAALCGSPAGCGIALQAVIGFETERTELRRTPLTLEIKSEPAGARVELQNGGQMLAVGFTPFSRELIVEQTATHTGRGYWGLLAGVGLELGLALVSYQAGCSVEECDSIGWGLALVEGVIGGAVDLSLALIALLKSERSTLEPAFEPSARISAPGYQELVSKLPPGTSYYFELEPRAAEVFDASTQTKASDPNARPHPSWLFILPVEGPSDMLASDALLVAGVEQSLMAALGPDPNDPDRPTHTLLTHFARSSGCELVMAVLDPKGAPAESGSTPCACDPDAAAAAALDLAYELLERLEAKR